MTRTELLSIARQLLTIPTAPYHEQGVRAFVEDYCRQLGLPVQRDRVGNVLVRYRRGTNRPPLVYMAHMDHPGFESLGGDRAEFLGGVPKEWFAGAPVRFYTGAGVVRAKVQRILPGWPKHRFVQLTGKDLKKNLPARCLGQWDVTRFAVRGGKLHATGIDDVLSVAVVLATLTELCRRGTKTHVWGAFTRAEEVGFNGAVDLARAGKIPRRSLVISMEMSKERPWAQIGNGPVVRVGDWATMFDAMATHFLCGAARKAAIRAQRCLMDGGTTEGTAFGGFGYRVGGLCLALGNYHNIGPNRQVRAEYVSVSDLEGLVRLTVAAAGEWPRFDRVPAALRRQVERIRASAPRKLKESR